MNRSLKMMPLALAALFALSTPRAAEAQNMEAPMKVDKSSTGKAFGSATHTVTAKVKSVDVKKREITLVSPKGEVETLEVGPDVKNLAQVVPGDEVVAVYHEGLFLQLQAANDPNVPTELTAKAVTAVPGEKPAAGVGVEVRATVTVKSMDMKSRMVTLEGPDGGLHRVEAGPGIKLDKVKVGDRIAAMYTESVAISVEPKKK